MMKEERRKLKERFENEYGFEAENRQHEKDLRQSPYEFTFQVWLVELDSKRPHSLWDYYAGLVKEGELDVAHIEQRVTEAREEHHLMGKMRVEATMSSTTRDSRRIVLKNLGDFDAQLSKAMKDFHRRFPFK